MKKQKKMILNMIIILVIIMIIIAIVITVINKKSNGDEGYMIGERETAHIDEPALSYKNTIFDVYDGKVDPLKISNRIAILFETYLPMISTQILDLSDLELREYFAKEENIIYINLGIQDEKKFINFIREIEKLDCNLENITFIQYKEGSYTPGEEYDTIEFEIGYENNKSLKCKSYIPLEYKSYEADLLNIEFEIL